MSELMTPVSSKVEPSLPGCLLQVTSFEGDAAGIHVTESKLGGLASLTVVDEGVLVRDPIATYRAGTTLERVISSLMHQAAQQGGAKVLEVGRMLK